MSWNIDIDNLKVAYKEQVVLDKLSLSFEANKINALMGKSGGGKSTLAKVLLGLLPIENGKVRIAGQDISQITKQEYRNLLKNFGMLFQDGALLSSLNLWRNVVLPLSENTKLSKEKLYTKAIEVLERVELKEFSEYYPDELSGGMRKRASLARALINEPCLLFCDEPTSGLDPITARKMDKLLLDTASLHKEMTIILITHDLRSVRDIAQNVVLLDNGKALFCGTKEDFYASKEESIVEFIQN